MFFVMFSGNNKIRYLQKQKTHSINSFSSSLAFHFFTWFLLLRFVKRKTNEFESINTGKLPHASIMMDESESNYYYNSTDDENDDDDVSVPLRKWALLKFHHKTHNFSFKLIDHRSSQQDVKLWDSFQDPPTEESSGSSIDTEWIESMTKIMKMFTYWLVFFVVAASSVLSKLSLLLMTSHVTEYPKKPFCDIASESTNIFLFNRLLMFSFCYQCRRKNLWLWFHLSKLSHGNGRFCSLFLCLNLELSCDQLDFVSSKA